MHLCFAIPWKTSWKLLVMFFHMIWTHVWLSLFHYSWSFVCVSFHVITWLLSFYCQDYVSYVYVLSSLIPALNALLRWSRLWWCMSPQKLFFCYHLPTRGRAGVKPGDVDTLQTYLWFLMLHACFTPIAICFVYTLWYFYDLFGLTY
jgi:hypothetical protein